jgi:hypothetical protein
MAPGTQQARNRHFSPFTWIQRTTLHGQGRVSIDHARRCFNPFHDWDNPILQLFNKSDRAFGQILRSLNFLVTLLEETLCRSIKECFEFV